MTSPLAYLKHVRDEFQHVVWPSNHTAVGHTFVVIFIAAAIAVLVGALDFVFTQLVSMLTGA